MTLFCNLFVEPPS